MSIFSESIDTCAPSINITITNETGKEHESSIDKDLWNHRHEFQFAYFCNDLWHWPIIGGADEIQRVQTCP